jgi:hypothetical protein
MKKLSIGIVGSFYIGREKRLVLMTPPISSIIRVRR